MCLHDDFLITTGILVHKIFAERKTKLPLLATEVAWIPDPVVKPDVDRKDDEPSSDRLLATC